MIEIRFHGRGGQGAVIGSEVLAHAFFMEDKYVQAFPSFGVERRGAPVTAFCRIDDNPIHLRNQIYTPDHAIVLDPTLLESVGVTQGLKKNGTIIINSRFPPSHYFYLIEEGFQPYLVDAAGIAVENRLGSPSNPIVNTAILGAFAKATGLVSMDSIKKAILEYVPVAKERNVKAAEAAFERVIKVEK